MATRPITGTITGFVLRMARESVPLSQAAMAEALGVDLATVQGWESGRRPVANMRAMDLLGLRRRLGGLGADAAITGMLDAAMDADRIISATLTGADGPHPLAEWVHTRDIAHMLAWALTGIRPPSLAGIPSPRRRGPSAASPLMPAQDRARFFEQLRFTAEAAPRNDAQGLSSTARPCTSPRTTQARRRWRGPRRPSMRDAVCSPGGDGPRSGQRRVRQPPPWPGSATPCRCGTSSSGRWWTTMPARQRT